MNAFRIGWFFIVLIAPGAAPTTRPAETPPPTRVTIDNFRFSPAEITVQRGATVTWVNVDDAPHTATSKPGTPAFDSGPLDTDAAFSFTFKTPGTYRYYCKIHPHMTATVVVK